MVLRKHNDRSSGQLGNGNITQHRIDSIPGASPFKSVPYRAGSKTRETEHFEIYKQLKASVIEHYFPEWAAPVLLDPKKDGRLFFVLNIVS